jgi:lysophospholipid acyltransferase (LPLAT)-like uncharacterized protein
MNKIRGFILGFIVWIIYKIISFTWKVHMHEPPEMKKHLSEKQGMLLSHFHGDEIVLISLTRRFKICTMTSTSKDGEIMNTVLHLLGAKTSRGSSTRGGISALKGLIRFAQSGYNCSFAVDGPKGPIYEVKPGVFELSRLTQSPIYSCGVYCDRAWTFPKSWNKTFFPKPFAKIVIYWMGPIPALDRSQDPRSPQLAADLKNLLFDARRNASNFIAASHSDN